MTDDEKRELIVTARHLEEMWKEAEHPFSETEFLESDALAELHATGFVAVQNARRLADALEGTLTEPEWEYRYAEKYGEELYTYGDFETAAEARAEAIEDTDIVVKRRTSGPWIEVPDV